MSKDQSKLSGDSDKDNLIQSSKGIVYELKPIEGASVVFSEGAEAAEALGAAICGVAMLGVARAGKSTLVNALLSKSGEHSEKEIQIIGVENSELENESEYSVELDEILTQLHEADSHIAETRQNTVRLGVETRSMLDDLRKQLG